MEASGESTVRFDLEQHATNMLTSPDHVPSQARELTQFESQRIRHSAKTAVL